MSNVRDLETQRFERLLVIGREGTDKNRRALWRCICDCGNSILVDGNQLQKGNKKSCGCLKTEKSKQNITKALEVRKLKKESEKTSL